MGVYIKGMEMPKNCYLCHFVFRSKANERVFCTAKEPILDISETLAENRADDCPLIELQPHGRLIDADALIKPKNQHVDVLADEWYVLVRTIDTAPTILEAEEGE